MKKFLLSVSVASLLIASQASHAQHGAEGAVPAEAISTPAELEPSIEPVSPQAGFIRGKIFDNYLTEELSDTISPSAILAVRSAYAQSLFKPLWTADGIRELVKLERELYKYGLIADEVTTRDLENISKQWTMSTSPNVRASADLKFTEAWIRMASIISGGLNDEGHTVSVEEGGVARSALVVAIVKAGEGEPAQSLEVFEPTHPQYVGLKNSLARYQKLSEDESWLAIPDGDVVEEGEQDLRIPALRKRLEIEGFSNDAVTTDLDVQSELEDPTFFDAATVLMLKEFQRHHGINDDGVLGPNTLEALNESPASKLDRIADTMMRWRSHGDMGDRYIWANTPSFLAEGWADGQREIRMRTIVGLPSRATPTFSDEVEYVVANPKWYVPVSILRRKLPKLENDSSYAAANNYKVFDRDTGEEVSAASVDWSDPESAVDYRLVQQPGEANALGELKIIFPNQYAVYLHGTPGRDLFDKAQRAFSSGCVRLEDPGAMAAWLARYDGQVDPQEVTTALDTKELERLAFDSITPVHITYMTVTMNDKGNPVFWRDVYDEDDGIQEVARLAPLYRDRETAGEP